MSTCRSIKWKLLNSLKFILVLNILVFILNSLSYINNCNAIQKQIIKSRQPESPVIFAITPTYARWTQKADLVRLSQTLLHVENFHWIVVEDANTKSKLVENLLSNSGLNFTHLNAKTDTSYKLKDKDPNWLLPRGVSQRNEGLKWIRRNVQPGTNGVLYFMDDDNTYSLELFQEMRSTKLAAVWPVGLVGGLKFEGPMSCTESKVGSWYTAWKPDRPFPLDMAGFAIHVSLILKYPEAYYSNEVPRGYLESDFLTKIGLDKTKVEPKAEQCSKILVWHTRTEKAKMKQEEKLIKIGKPSDPSMEV